MYIYIYKIIQIYLVRSFLINIIIIITIVFILLSLYHCIIIGDVFMAHLQGLWQQRQGFLTAAAKREQRHLAEAEAEVLRHVAKLVPEAEVPDGRHREVFKIDLSSMREKWMLALRKGFRSCSSESFLFLLPSFFFFSFLFLSFLTSLLSLSHFSSHFWSHFPFWSSGFGGIIFCTSWVPLKIGFIRGQKDKQATRGRSHLYYTVSLQ